MRPTSRLHFPNGSASPRWSWSSIRRRRRSLPAEGRRLRHRIHADYPARSAELSFTPAFVRSDFTYLVPAGSALGSAMDVDRPGIRVAAVRGHASTIALVRLLKQAQPVYADTYDPTFELLRSGNADAFASIREMLIQYSAQLPGSRVLDDSYQTSLAGVAVAKEKAERLGYVSEFLEELKRSSSLKKMVDDNGLRGVEVAIGR